MLTLIIVVVLLSILIFVFAKFLDKFMNPGVRKIFTIVIWALTLFFGYKIYDSIQEPIRFDKLKEQRFQVAVNKLLDLKDAQLAHKLIKGKYTDNIDSLIHFIETAEFIIEERRDTSVADVVKNRQYGLSDDSGYYINKVIVTEIGRVKVKDSLFKDSDRYKRLNSVKIEGIDERIPIEMKADILQKGDFRVPVFMAKIIKKSLLSDQEPYLVEKENSTMSVDGINGSEIILGSIEEISMAGNWPKKYGKNE